MLTAISALPALPTATQSPSTGRHSRSGFPDLAELAREDATAARIEYRPARAYEPVAAQRQQARGPAPTARYRNAAHTTPDGVRYVWSHLPMSAGDPTGDRAWNECPDGCPSSSSSSTDPPQVGSASTPAARIAEGLGRPDMTGDRERHWVQRVGATLLILSEVTHTNGDPSWIEQDRVCIDANSCYALGAYQWQRPLVQK